MPYCANGVNDIFERKEWDLKQLTDDCTKRWKVTPDPTRAEMLWGGKRIQAASNIIFSNGERDPWYAGGVLDEVNPSIHIIKIPNACHHEDLRPSGPNDPPALLQVREKEATIIRDWINKYYIREDHFPQEWIDHSLNLSELMNVVYTMPSARRFIAIDNLRSALRSQPSSAFHNTIY